MQLAANTELQNGKYRIIRVLGQGGFGITYLAENTFFERKVAIKEFFPKDFCGRDNTSHLTLGTQNNAETVEKLKARFLKEAKNIAKLYHDGIIKIHDIFEENNTAYYVMDYIEGENLNEMVKRNGPLTESKAIEYITKIGSALEYIHTRNMTHFDVKPANIVVRRSDDEPILIDFGLSKQYDKSGDATSTLIQGTSRGYSPMELYNMGSIATFSPQTDVYSLAATLYYLVTGKVPPSAAEVYDEGITLPSSVSPSTANATRSAMVTRSKRPTSIDAWLTMLFDGIAATATQKMRYHSETHTTEEHSTKNEEATRFINHTETPVEHHKFMPSNDDKTVKSASEKSEFQESSQSRNPQSSNKSLDIKNNNTSLWIFAIVAIGIGVLIASFCQRHTQDYDYAVASDTVVAVVEDDWSTLEDTVAAAEVIESGYMYYENGKCVGYFYGNVDMHGRPHGDGKVKYYSDDKYGRSFFTGLFENGKRKNGTLKYLGGQYYIGTFTSEGNFSSGKTYFPNGVVNKTFINGLEQ